MPKKPRKRKLYAAIAKLAVRVEKMRRKKEHAALQRDGVDVSADDNGCVDGDDARHGDGQYGGGTTVTTLGVATDATDTRAVTAMLATVSVGRVRRHWC